MGCAVMTASVFDPKYPDIKFEKSWRLPALELKKENPYTKTPLQSEQLQLDIELKQVIDTFVKSKVEEHSA